MIGATLLAWALLSGETSQLETARKLAAAGQHGPAIAEYQKALETAPTNSALWVELANTRMAAGQTAGAIGDYARAVRISPSDLAAQKALAQAVEKSGNAPRALLEWRRAAQLAQGAEQAEAEARAEAILQGMGQAPKTVAQPSPDTSKATVKSSVGEPKAPPSSAPKAVHTSNDDPADLKKIVEIWKKGDRDKALEQLRGVIKKSATPEAYYYGGLMRLEEKKFDMAEFNLKKATSDKTLAGDAWYWLGRALEGRKKTKEAKDAFKKSLELSPKGEFAAEARARLEEPRKEPAKTDTATHAAKPSGAPARPEPVPPNLPDSLRAPFTWYAPDLPFPKGDGSEVGKMLEEAAKQSSQKQNDLALSTLEQLKLKESASPSAEMVGLASGLVYNAMGLPANAIGQIQGFLKDHPNHALADYAKFVEGVCLLRVGKADSAALRLGPLPIAPKGSMWTESARQSALAEALRISGKHKESVAALKLAFDAETDPKARRSLALRLFRTAKKAGQAEQALSPLSEARKACDKSAGCLQVAVSLADLQWQTGKPALAQPLYEEISKTWPTSSETPWALYQVGTTLASQGKRPEAQAAWKHLLEHHPGSYWAGQARLRLEDAVWQSRYQEAK